MRDEHAESAAPSAGRVDEAPQLRLLIGGEWRLGSHAFDVVSPATGQVVAHCAAAGAGDVAAAVDAAVAARAAAAAPGYRRAELLRRVQAGIAARGEEIACAITRETGKPIRDARTEVRRSVETIGFCADEAIRIEGRQVPLDGSELGAGKLALTMRFPVGVVGAIVPFNAPFNMACHKIGPAIAAGNSVILKTPPEAPGCLALLASIVAEAGAAPGTFGLLHGGVDVGETLVRDPRVDFISFTGSTSAGAAVKAAAGLRRTTLELGGLGPNIVHADADPARVAPICALNGTRLAGQSCVSVQNLFVHRDLLAPFTEAFVAAMRGMRVGDPFDERTDVGPMINERAARRVEQWVDEARSSGAAVLCGGTRERTYVAPTAITDADPSMKVVCQEIFGPVIVLRPYDDIAAPIAWINGSGFGLNCGLFTDSTPVAIRALREIRCGGLIVNGTSTFRPDQTPYGGVGNSGNGREGPSRAVLDMTDERLIVFNY
ncbi:MAG: aldehyde dehydrogenase family protein [Lautropia sp.]